MTFTLILLAALLIGAAITITRQMNRLADLRDLNTSLRQNAEASAKRSNAWQLQHDNLLASIDRERTEHSRVTTDFRNAVNSLRDRGNLYRDALDEIIKLEGNLIKRAQAAHDIAVGARAATKTK